jgi:hypothetical protein
LRIVDASCDAEHRFSIDTEPDMNAADTIPTSVRYLAELFADALAKVTFPDVDASSLAAAVAKLDAMTADAARLEEELAKAKQSVDAARDDLLRLSARAHAYARVFAEDDEALRARLDAITLPRARPRPSTTSPSAPARVDAAPTSSRKRKKAASDDDATLFVEPEQAAAE